MNNAHHYPALARSLAGLAAAAGILAAAPPALAWDAAGHRLITLIALDNLTGDAPAFLREPQNRAAIAENATEPDRWRSVRMGQLMNVNNPDHYIDVEDLEAYGMTLQTIPPLRYEFVSQMVTARDKAGDQFKGRPPSNPARDVAKTDQWPGFAPYAVIENYGKLVSTFKLLRTLDRLNDPARAHQLQAAQGNAISIMGVMSHYVGDLAQPLHTTRHHHGWVGENPRQYTTRYTFHAYIDGGVLEIHELTYDALRGTPAQARPMEPRDPWAAILAHVQRSHDQVVPLYDMEQSGELIRESGKQLITARLIDAASMLAALYNSAWSAAEPSQQDIENFLKYDGSPLVPTPPPAENAARPADAPGQPGPGGS